MIVFAQDLNAPNTTNNNQESQVTNDSNFSDSFFGFESLFSDLNLDTVINSLNYFTLGSSIIFTIIFLITFFDYRIFFGGGELTNEKNGVSSLVLAIQLWWRYILVLVFYVLYGFFRESAFGVFFGFLVVLVYLVKILVDIINVLSTLNYFDWSAEWSQNLKKVLKFKK